MIVLYNVHYYNIAQYQSLHVYIGLDKEILLKECEDVVDLFTSASSASSSLLLVGLQRLLTRQLNIGINLANAPHILT